MFFGQYEHSLDNKNRLMIPRKIRDNCGSVIFVLKGFDGCLSVYRQEAFEKLVEEVSSLPFNLKNSRDYIRNQLASACEIEIDKLGRMQIPAQLISKYQLAKEVVVIGVGDHFEIWNREKYLVYEKNTNDNFEQIAEAIEVNKTNG